eukprot:jgi/Chrzof1/12881/Cz07g10220.t1
MSKTAKADKLQQKSPAEFFAENKNIAGFDNPGKCLYTTIRELVENALDSSESIGELPFVEITIEEISKKRLNHIRGLEHHDRIDEALYHDFESEDARKRRLAKEEKEKNRLEKLAAKKGEAVAAAEGKKAAAAEAKKAPQIRGNLFYRVTVKDNGSGMPHQDIPNMLGRVLSGTKYGVKQTRGKFGLGAKMALIWSKMTTGLPFEIYSATVKQDFRSHYVLDIDIHKNEPNVHKSEKLDNTDHWHGAQLSVTIEGNWSNYRSKILKYLRQIAVITPYAQFSFDYKADDDKNNMKLLFKRRTDVMPPAPKITKHHPSSVDLMLIKRLITETKCTSMLQFLSKEFDSISKEFAGRLVEEMRSGVDMQTDPKELTTQQVVRLHQLLHEAKFSDPSGSHLSPAGEYNLRLGVIKELHPDLIATYQGDVRVFEGHAFIVEAAVSVGGRDMKPGINVYRFANRIPLLFEGGSDVITKTALKRINWGAYKINQGSDKVGVFVSIVSTKIPFKGAGKEYIGDDVEEMVAAVKQAIQQCGVQLKAKIARALAAREHQQRKRNLVKYIPNTCSAIWNVLEGMADATDARAGGPKRRKLMLQQDILSKIKREEVRGVPRGGWVAGGVDVGMGINDAAQCVAAACVSETLFVEQLDGGFGVWVWVCVGWWVTLQTLQHRLTEHVERIDTDLALEYQVQQGMAGAVKQAVFLMPQTAKHSYGPELHSCTCVVKLLHSYK